MKASEDAAIELPLNDERLEPAKRNRHVEVAVSHLSKRRDALTMQINKLVLERDGVTAAIEALG